MDDASRLDEVVVERGWRYTWLGSDPYVFYEPEYLARIGDGVLDRLGVGISVKQPRRDSPRPHRVRAGD